MDNKLQQLTDKLYSEGLSKGQAQGQKLIEAAQLEASKILAEAKLEAQKLKTTTEQENDLLRKSVEEDLKSATRNTLQVVKKQIEEVISAKVLGTKTKEALCDATYLKEIIKIAIGQWNASQATSVSLDLILPADKQAEFSKVFTQAALLEMGNGIEITYQKQIKTGFKIGEKGGSYQLSFTEGDFDILFKSFMRPKLVKLLF